MYFIPLLKLKHTSDATMPMDPGTIRRVGPYASNMGPRMNIYSAKEAT